MPRRLTAWNIVCWKIETSQEPLNGSYHDSIERKKMFKSMMCFVGSAMMIAGIAGCDVDQVEEGQMPNVDMSADPGTLPEYDVETPDVDVETEERTVTVPDVDVDPAD